MVAGGPWIGIQVGGTFGILRQQKCVAYAIGCRGAVFQMKVVIEIAAVNGEFRVFAPNVIGESFGVVWFVVSNQAVAEFVVGGSCAGQSGQIRLVGVAAIYDAVIEVGLSEGVGGIAQIGRASCRE